MKSRVPYQVVTAAEFPHGVRCGRCDKVIPRGATYETELDDQSVTELTAPLTIEEQLGGAEPIVPVALIICATCSQ